MWLFLVGMFLPFLGLVTYGYRAALLYYGVRDAAYFAAKAPTFSAANGPTSAQAIAQTTWARDTAAWSGVSGTLYMQIIEKSLASGSETIYNSKLAAIDTTNNVYFERAVANGTIDPLIKGWTWVGMTIPGLNAPYQLQMNYQVYVENTAGLKQ